MLLPPDYRRDAMLRVSSSRRKINFARNSNYSEANYSLIIVSTEAVAPVAFIKIPENLWFST